MATTIPESQRHADPIAEPRGRGENVASQQRVLKSTFGLIFGCVLVVISLAFAALGQLMALALLLVGVPLAIWGGTAASRTTPRAAARAASDSTRAV